MEKGGNRFLFTKSRRRKQRGPSKPAETHWEETSHFLPPRTGSDAPPSAPSHARRAPAAPSRTQQDGAGTSRGRPPPASRVRPPASCERPRSSQIGTLNSKSCSNRPGQITRYPLPVPELPEPGPELPEPEVPDPKFG